ncbi:hypothetical protein OAJ18_00535 [Pelagibacteraceae bacterium]|nr:hypothetical protein [Pelagibacteraceae bacterium]
MIIKTITTQSDIVLSLCAVCITDNSGGKIALTIIISALILLGIGNWAWKKYFSNKKEISQEK